VSRPSIVYVDSLPDEPVLFTGAHEVPDLTTWVRTQLSFPFVFIESLDDFPQTTDSSSVFLFKYLDRSDSKFKAIQAAFTPFRAFGTSVYALTAYETSLTAFRSSSLSVSFDGRWTTAELTQFFRKTIFPLLSELTTVSIQRLRKNRMSAIVAFIEPALDEIALTSIAKSLESDFPVTFVDTTSGSLLHRILGVRIVEDEPAVILYDPAESRWLPYEGNFAEDGIRQWLAGIKRAGRVWQRPLEGPKGLLAQSLAGRRAGTYLVAGIVVMIGLLGVQLGCKCQKMRRPGAYSKL
jgi:hypothetical protein